MKTLRTFAAAVIAAAALTAVLGAGTASATVLCENTPATPNHCSNKVASGTSIDFSLESGTSMLLKGPFGETLHTCTESTLQGPVSNSGSTTATVSLNLSLSFGSCSRPTTTNAAGSIEIHHIAGSDDGTVTSTGMTLVVHNIPFFGSCSYVTNATDIGRLTGKLASAPTFDFAGTITSKNGCPNATLSGSYIYTGTTNFVVAAG